MKVPRVDLKPQEEPLRNEIISRITEVIDSYNLIVGKNVEELEKKAAEYIGVPDSIGVSSGTDALYLALKALDIGKGDEVITPPFTMAANVEAILFCGAKPVFADVNKETFNIMPTEIKKKITQKTKAILPVHLFGCPAEMGKIMNIAEKNKLFVVEDCAQSFGADIKGKKCGSFGNLSATSFYPTKNLGCYGDGGMVFVNDTAYAGKIRMLRFHGQEKQYIHKYVGGTMRLDEIQAAVILPKLKLIDDWNNRRKEAAARYRELLRDVKEVTLPIVPEGTNHIFHLYTIKAGKRSELEKFLADNGVGATINYPKPLHLQEAYSHLGCRKGDYPNAEYLCEHSISIPMFVGITREQQEYVAGKIREFYALEK